MPWIRMIKEYVDCSEAWPDFFKKSNLEIIKIIAKTVSDYHKCGDDYNFFPKHGNPLVFAAMTRNIEIVAELLKTQSGDQPKDEHGYTPLHRAASNGDLEICKMIVEKFKDVNPKDNQDNTPLHEAAVRGNLEVCQFIVAFIKENNPNGFTLEIDLHEKTPFHWAAEMGHIEVCRFLIDSIVVKNPVFEIDFNYGMDGTTLLHDMANLPENAGLEACRLIIERTENILPKDTIVGTPLHSAIQQDNFDICELIIDSLRDKNPIMNSITGKTLLHEMVQMNKFSVPFQLILERINEKNPQDMDGQTPLHYAAFLGKFDTFKLIFQSVDDKNPKDFDKTTPLHLASSEGHLSICQLIIANVADKNPEDDYKITPLHTASRNNHYEVCKLIIENIKDIHPKNHEGKTPYDIAKEEGNTSIMKLFGYQFSTIPKSAITRPHLPPGFWGF